MFYLSLFLCINSSYCVSLFLVFFESVRRILLAYSLYLATCKDMCFFLNKLFFSFLFVGRVGMCVIFCIFALANIEKRFIQRYETSIQT